MSKTEKKCLANKKCLGIWFPGSHHLYRPVSKSLSLCLKGVFVLNSGRTDSGGGGQVDFYDYRSVKAYDYQQGHSKINFYHISFNFFKQMSTNRFRQSVSVNLYKPVNL